MQKLMRMSTIKLKGGAHHAPGTPTPGEMPAQKSMLPNSLDALLLGGNKSVGRQKGAMKESDSVFKKM